MTPTDFDDPAASYGPQYELLQAALAGLDRVPRVGLAYWLHDRISRRRRPGGPHHARTAVITEPTRRCPWRTWLQTNPA